MCRYRLGRAKSPEGQKSSDEESGHGSTSVNSKKMTAAAAEAGTNKASSAAATDCKNVPTTSHDKKTASDKETTSGKNCSDQRKKDVDDSQLTDEGKR